jgi:hypothetical protein
VKDSCEYGNDPSGSTHRGEFIEFKKVSAP